MRRACIAATTLHGGGGDGATRTGLNIRATRGNEKGGLRCKLRMS